MSLNTIGTDDFLEWTVIGDVVNTASRLEKACAAGYILVSHTAAEPIMDHPHIRRSTEVAVRGMDRKILAYHVDRVTLQTPDGEEMILGIDEAIDICDMF